MSTDVVRVPEWSSSRCLVCKSGYEIMAVVNRALINGASYVEVFSLLSEMPPGSFPKNKVPTINSIKNHTKNHLPIKDAAARRILERRATEQQIDFENAVDSIVTGRGALDVMIDKGFRSMMEGKNEPTIKETIEAIKLTHLLDKEASDSFDAAQALYEMHRILAAVERIVPPIYFKEIQKELARKDDSSMVIDEDEDWGDDEDNV